MNDPSHDEGDPPGRLSRISITGFRSIRELDLELRPLTVLIGANGSGKSNLIAFFNLLSALVSERLQVYVGTRGGASSILHYGPRVTPTAVVKLALRGATGASTYTIPLTFAAPDRLILGIEMLELERPDEAPGRWAISGGGGLESTLRPFAALPDELTFPLLAREFLAQLEALRVYHFHDTSDTAPVRRTQDLGDNRYLRRQGDNLAPFLHMLRRSRPAHYANILSTVRLAVPFLQDFVLEPDPNGVNIQLRWRDHSIDGEFGAHQLSDGSLRAIALITVLLQPEELMPSIIIIDEPELGLHPAAVTTVAHLIQAASLKRQVLVATQSSRLIANLSPEDVVVVEREVDERGHGSSTFKRLSKDALGGWLEDYDLGQLYDMNVTGGGPQ